jgi:hypothetical protein
MILKSTDDIELIRSVVKEVYQEITTDDDPCFDAFKPVLENRKYLAGYVKGECIGIVVYCFNKDRTMIHIVVKPEFRGRYAWILAKKALKDRAGIIFTEIPDLYPNVIKFAEKLGFEIVDRSKTCLIGGAEYAVNTLRLE